jgi:hypothetical protein
MGGVPAKEGQHTEGELRHLEVPASVCDGCATVSLQDGIDIWPQMSVVGK